MFELNLTQQIVVYHQISVHIQRMLTSELLTTLTIYGSRQCLTLGQSNSVPLNRLQKGVESLPRHGLVEGNGLDHFPSTRPREVGEYLHEV